MKQSGFIAVLLAGAAMSAWADVYRCTAPDGSVAYQQSPCAAGTQKTIDDADTKARQRAQAQQREAAAQAAQALAQRVADTRRQMQEVRVCLQKKSCSAMQWAMLLEGQNLGFVAETLGKADSTQYIAGELIDHFTVPTTDGRKRARLQLNYKGLTIDRVSLY